MAQVCSHGTVRSWSVIVPAKRLAVAKSRLRPFTDNLSDDSLSGDLRVAHDELVLALLADTVAAAVACPAVGSVLVVTDDPAAVDVGRALGARTVADEPGRGLNAALEHGARFAGDIRGDIAVAALSSDLPALRPEELAAALRAAGAAPRCFVPDAHGTGTTLLTAVGTPLAPHFGPESARAHRSSGAVALSGDWPGLVQDVDTETDLRAALALGTGPRTSTLAGRFRTAR
ncbi:MAG: 2-phospho-L-lactate guanylyltransferase CofC [Blastococcus sp.]|nr:2-phospho-L-lactate guanylyltransferase CofC [Blastococcus sp.]